MSLRCQFLPRQTKSRSSRLNLTLMNVREFLPSALVYLLSDAGDPFDLEAQSFNVSAFMAEMHMNQAGTRNRNWTCARWFGRLGAAAKWAAARGAKYLMHWEEPSRAQHVGKTKCFCMVFEPFEDNFGLDNHENSKNPQFS